MDFREAYRNLGMPMRTYAVRYLAPLAAGAIAATLLVWVVVLPMLPGIARIPIALAIPLFFAVVGAILPNTLRDRRKHQIEQSIHFYITRAGVLASANLSTIAVLQRLTDRETFGALAEETERVVFLVTRWNMSISEACRAVGKRTPSAIFADFLERLAYALDSGEELSAFLQGEQSVVMEDFATVYAGALYNIEALRNAFMSLAMAVVFMIVFGIVSPVLTGFNASDFMMYALIFVGLIDGIFLILMMGKVPTDPLWHPKNDDSPRERVVKRALAPSILASLALAVVLLLVPILPIDMALVAAAAPPVAVGLLVKREEAAVRRRDDNYPAFVRALGSATSAGGGVVRQVLKRLRHHNFGPLTTPLDRLYRRLHLRVDDAQAWRSFAAETGSNLVAKFNAMFVEGTRAGGEPEHIAKIISANYVRILNLRKHRKQTAQSFRSMMLGLTAGMAFTMHVGLGVLQVLVHLFQGAGAAAASGLISLNPQSVDFAVLALLLQAALIVHALLGSLMTQAVEGGSFLSGYVDFVLLMAVATAAGFGSDVVFHNFFH